MNTTTKERGRVISGGMGGFLNPPTHPEHGMRVEFDLRRRKGNRGGMSLSAAADCEWLDSATRVSARSVLAKWNRPAIESPEVQDWIHRVLGYFAGCYQSNSGSWNVSDLLTDRTLDPVLNHVRHAGVHLIRKYYPDFMPTREHFASAYWGGKPTTEGGAK